MSRERVDRLIALALDDGASENERRNAALQAVKLIAKEELLDDHEEVAKLRKQVRDLKASLRTIAQVVRKHGGDDQVDPVVVTITEDDVAEMRRDKQWSIASSRFDGRTCPECNLPIRRGDMIATKRVELPFEQPSTFHLRCFHKRKTQGRL